MLTNADIKKLAEILATKKDIVKLDDRLGKVEDKLGNLENRLEKIEVRVEKMDIKIDSVKSDLEKSIKFTHDDMVDSFKTVLDIIGDIKENIDSVMTEHRGMRTAIGDLEERLQKMEEKVFPQL